MPATKTCMTCGRTIEWRKKWERNWNQVRYCSKRCRSRSIRDVDRELEAAICHTLEARAYGASMCPSEAAQRVAIARDLPGDAWRDLMEPARMAARRLVDRGRVDITQGGSVVDPSRAKGPIRIRLRG